MTPNPLTQTYAVRPFRLLLAVLLWMLLVTGGCAVVWSWTQDPPPAQPRRTRPPGLITLV